LLRLKLSKEILSTHRGANVEMQIDLRALGKHWGTLLDGRYLEVRRHDSRLACIDLVETARTGRTVIVRHVVETPADIATVDGTAAQD